MSGTDTPSVFFVGWDVGGWNCDRNRSSRDALVVLDGALRMAGRSWRGNLRAAINDSGTSRAFLHCLLGLCGVESHADEAAAVLAIDTPLGFSEAFVRLVSRAGVAGPVGQSVTNPYLFRRTERFLFERGLAPLSPVKDMIGSQATKGMHVLGKFAPLMERCGVWRSEERPLLTVIEAYPSGCKGSRLIDALRARVRGSPGDTDDERDARTCALIAYLYAHQPHSLASPDGSVPEREGWIWLPQDALQGVCP